jgi:DNA-binding NtrC family response regulator
MSDAEFFGHGRSAFTGADRERVGLVRKAHGGVLFLDELECLSLANQAKLLRAVGEGEVKPVGSDEIEKVSVRYVAATNRQPQAMLASGELRADLYWRLREFQIEIPPLRDRPEDIPLLARHFLARRGGALSTRALDALTRCSWPGNVRQLDAVLQSASAFAGGELIDLPHLDLSACGQRLSSVPPSDAPGSGTMDDAKRDAIERALAANNHNVVHTAHALKIGRATLRNLINKFGLKRPTNPRKT